MKYYSLRIKRIFTKSHSFFYSLRSTRCIDRVSTWMRQHDSRIHYVENIFDATENLSQLTSNQIKQVEECVAAASNPDLWSAFKIICPIQNANRNVQFVSCWANQKKRTLICLMANVYLVSFRDINGLVHKHHCVIKCAKSEKKNIVLSDKRSEHDEVAFGETQIKIVYNFPASAVYWIWMEYVNEISEISACE